MSNLLLDKFGKYLISKVRDTTIAKWDLILEGEMKDEQSRRIHADMCSLEFDAKALVQKIVPLVIDDCLHDFLSSLDETEDIRIAVSEESDSTESISAISDGLAGELFSDEGWIARFSNERHGEY